MSAGDVVTIAALLGGTIAVKGTLDADDLVNVLDVECADGVVPVGQIVCGSRVVNLGGSMPVTLTGSDRLAWNGDIAMTLTGEC